MQQERDVKKFLIPGCESPAAPEAMQDAQPTFKPGVHNKRAIVESGLAVAGNSAKDTVNCCTEVIILR